VNDYPEEEFEGNEYPQEEDQIREYPDEEVEGKENEAIQPLPQRNAVTGSTAPLKVSCVQYIIHFNKKIDFDITFSINVSLKRWKK
jgi:hypothetical protein